jgi:V-type H+-transporting ATPase subunit F
MAAPASSYKDRQFLAVIGDEVCIPPTAALAPRKPNVLPLKDTVTGMLLAGIGHVTPAPNSSKNFLIVDAKTETKDIENTFDEFTSRKDIGILLINQHVRAPPPRRKREY